jgi:uncharacterized protein YjiS (DUF1127 family)
MLCGQCPPFCSDLADGPTRHGGPDQRWSIEMTRLPVREPTTMPDDSGRETRTRRHGMHATPFASIFATFRHWSVRRRQRRTLGGLTELDDHLLKDIGVSRQEAARLCAKWFWQR